MTIEEMKKELSKRLGEKRYRHSLGVMETAVFLAHRFGVDEKKARLAGLLHDCGREYPNGELLSEATRRGIPIGPVERAMPLLLHACIGADRARELYGIEDEGILQAICRHTVGGENMTELDKIIWFADMIEPGRAYPEVEKLRRLSRESELDEMLLEGLTDSILFVAQQGRLLHPMTILARNEILLKGGAHGRP